MKKNLSSIIILGLILALIYLVFGLYIVQGEGDLSNLVEGYEAGYSQDDTSQAKGLDLIKSNWNKDLKDRNLMQRQVDKYN